MHLKPTICLSCQPAVIFINNSENILWDSFCFEIQSCDSFHSREHWVNCNVLTCQWMVPCRAKLVMNWYLLRPKQAQGTTSIPSSMSPAMMDRREDQQRPRRERCELTSKRRQGDCFHQPTDAVVSCVTCCCFAILPCTLLMDLLYHGAGWTLERRRKNRRDNSPPGPTGRSSKPGILSHTAELETNSTSGEARPPHGRFSRFVAFLWHKRTLPPGPQHECCDAIRDHPDLPATGLSCTVVLRVCPKCTATPPHCSKTYKPTAPDGCRLGKPNTWLAPTLSKAVLVASAVEH